MEPKIVCGICLKEFEGEFTLSRHYKQKHNFVPEPKAYAKGIHSFKCLEGCDSSFKLNAGLVRHLQLRHNLPFLIEDLNFGNIEDFKSWKETVERENLVSYTQRRTNYYECNRSIVGRRAKTNAVERAARQSKSQGSCKLPHKCTSQMVLKTSETGSIEVKWVKTHYGHELELEHIALPKADKREIVKKLLSGVPKSRILRSVADTLTSVPQRVDYLTAKDIDNIKGSFGIQQDGRRHANDAQSVAMWVEECRQQEHSPILYYKEQGAAHLDGFTTEDMCIIFMNYVQKEMLQKFGGNIIAIDGTHGLNGYDFQLVTVLVVDEFSQGFPVAFMFTNRKDTGTYTHLFACIKGQVGIVRPNVFMSDMECAFYNAFMSVMGEACHVLFCSWHVDRAWQSNLSKISDAAMRKEVYVTLKILQQDTSLNNFPVSLNTFVTALFDNPSTITFGSYFKANYVNNFKKWAYCFRQDCGINTNMHLESMHKIIKYFFLDRKSVKRLDKGIDAVMNYLKARSLSRLVDLGKGKRTPKSAANFKKHKISLNFELHCVDRIGEYSYKVSNTRKGTEYLVNNNLGNESVCCGNYCSVCKICIHYFSCECEDFRRGNFCKHIHMVHVKFGDGAILGIVENSRDAPFLSIRAPRIHCCFIGGKWFEQH